MSEFLTYQFFDSFLDWFNTQAIGIAAFIISFVNNYILSFFEISAVNQFMNFSTWINGIVFAVSFIVVAADIAEEKVSDKPIMYSVVFTNVGKALLFSVFARYLGQWSMELANAITSFFGINLQADKMSSSISEIILQIGTGVFEIQSAVPFLNLVFLIVLIVALVYFAVTSLRRFGEMFVHILTSALYIPDIMRGDTTKMGDWLRQMISIVLNYVIIYILFFLGCVFFDADNVLVCLSFWLTMPVVSKLLNKFGWSSGTQGQFGTMAMQTGMLAVIR